MIRYPSLHRAAHSMAVKPWLALPIYPPRAYLGDALMALGILWQIVGYWSTRLGERLYEAGDRLW